GGLIYSLASGGGGERVWLPDEFLLDRGFAAPEVRLPLWFPARGPGSAIYALDASRARAAGLRLRPLAQTVAETAAWDRTLPAGRPLRMGMSPEAEQALLEAWAAPR
ncbi:MAG: NAD-dependent epimerase, partial [Gemmatimonadetes bacterium]|nr:NAD-dependent epimerase [Gemmatimonadota bacterium]